MNWKINSALKCVVIAPLLFVNSAASAQQSLHFGVSSATLFCECVRGKNPNLLVSPVKCDEAVTPALQRDACEALWVRHWLLPNLAKLFMSGPNAPVPKPPEEVKATPIPEPPTDEEIGQEFLAITDPSIRESRVESAISVKGGLQEVITQIDEYVKMNN